MRLKITKRANGEEIFTWIKNYIDELNTNKESISIITKHSPNKIIDKNKQNLFNCGYFFLEKLYYELKLNKICDEISEKYSFK